MAVQMLCPNLRCRKILSVPEQVRGKLVQCHHCSTLFRVPVPIAKAPKDASGTDDASKPASPPTSSAA